VYQYALSFLGLIVLTNSVATLYPLEQKIQYESIENILNELEHSTDSHS
jgi:hypothetical protein